MTQDDQPSSHEAPQNAPQPKRVRPAAPSTPTPSPDAPKAPAAPLRPSRPARPAAPMARPDEEPSPETLDPPQELDEPQVFIADEEEDLVIAPPPEPTVFAPRKIASPRKSGSIEFRRTLIPILLSFGVALPITGAWWFRLDDESPLKVIGLAFPITMIALGAILLGLAVLNMAQVRKLLQPPAPSEDAL